jgi:hypothetical protein
LMRAHGINGRPEHGRRTPLNKSLPRWVATSSKILNSSHSLYSTKKYIKMYILRILIVLRRDF